MTSYELSLKFRSRLNQQFGPDIDMGRYKVCDSQLGPDIDMGHYKVCDSLEGSQVGPTTWYNRVR